ncbi:MAG: hypothetical protein J2P46_11575 [Zavarzinella sp.]|nr:hypothetical protein [Zavarzinella sp.]
MTRLDTQPSRPQFHVEVPAARRPAVEAMLRDIAYVLHLTQRVKAEIVAEREEREAARLAPAATAV